MPITDFSTLQTQLGVLTWPLLLCAFLALMICLERSALFLHQTLLSIWPKKQAWVTSLRQSRSTATTENVSALLAQTCAQQDLLARGATLLLKQVHQPKVLREELLSLWLNKQQRDLQAGLKVLQVIGIISPLLGLLGTVLGLIDMFAQLGQSQGPVTPAQLSAGLGLAMNTTAAGLIIAVPAITAAHLFVIWAQGQCLRAGHVLNQLNLWLAGIEDISIDNNQYQAFNQVSNSSTEQKSAFNSHSQIEPQT
ncbi:flagellar motor protein MotA [Shewanella baltica]|uniref:MotA/TolQ/ExbB proton channel family protein n=1 Tax=Shewanella baltica TaxID=62322 RepID=UPI00217E8AF3|nr:MotA/TolQ/ExbB proton channel family protein [Shewanella baltica]MCS6127876.1 flagellar motor protein MotA [Shewanella baltica]MCS6139949.1 flagellar motor protein MotA [Shewanella baltica]MCS6146090.1 flagellar motor protein MotA [Shewanella baltica]MCS6170620.1 flagellar motor protein MotA [Shewanella baltica]MCS6187835.1 flagellar motor protein MotA [Shewanella baltica]